MRRSTLPLYFPRRPHSRAKAARAAPPAPAGASPTAGVRERRRARASGHGLLREDRRGGPPPGRAPRRARAGSAEPDECGDSRRREPSTPGDEGGWSFGTSWDCRRPLAIMGRVKIGDPHPQERAPLDPSRPRSKGRGGSRRQSALSLRLSPPAIGRSLSHPDQPWMSATKMVLGPCPAASISPRSRAGRLGPVGLRRESPTDARPPAHRSESSPGSSATTA